MTRIIVVKFIETFLKYPLSILVLGIGMATAVYIPFYAFGQETQYFYGATMMVAVNDTIDSYRNNKLIRIYRKEVNEVLAEEIWGLLETDVFLHKVIDRIDLNNPELQTSLSGRRQKLVDELRENIEIAVIDNDRANNKLFFSVVTENPEFSKAVIFAFYDAYIDEKKSQGAVSEQQIYQTFNHILESKEERRELVVGELTEYLEQHPKEDFFRRRDIEQLEISLIERELDDLNEDIQFFEDIIYVYDFNTVTSDQSVEETYILFDTGILPWLIYQRPGLITALTYWAVYVAVACGTLLVIFFVFDQTIIFPLDITQITDLPILTITALEPDPDRKWYQFVRRRKTPTPIVWAWSEFDDDDSRKIKRKPLPAPVSARRAATENRSETLKTIS